MPYTIPDIIAFSSRLALTICGDGRRSFDARDLAAVIADALTAEKHWIDSHAVRIEMPIKCISTANAREHYAAKARRTKTQREAAHILTLQHSIKISKLKYPFDITLTKVNPPRCRNLDADNLANSMKSVQDGIAAALKIDDGDETRAVWNYRQSRGKEHGVIVEIRGSI